VARDESSSGCMAGSFCGVARPAGTPSARF
jgi:hypothetical protein